jgi:hypothetical protein
MALPDGFSGKKQTICALPSSVRSIVNFLAVCACAMTNDSDKMKNKIFFMVVIVLMLFSKLRLKYGK